MFVFVKTLTLHVNAMGCGNKEELVILSSSHLSPIPRLFVLEWNSGLNAGKYPTAELHLQSYFVFVHQYFVVQDFCVNYAILHLIFHIIMLTILFVFLLK